MKNSFISTETYAASMPCLFCSHPTVRLIHMKGCKERKYEDVGFFICDTCRETMTDFLNNIPNNSSKAVAIPEISAEMFTFELWESGYWDALGLGYSESMEEGKLHDAIKEYGIGYCKSSRLSVRPRDDEYVAVMCERNGEKFWFHVYRDDIEELLEDAA